MLFNVFIFLKDSPKFDKNSARVCQERKKSLKYVYSCTADAVVNVVIARRTPYCNINVVMHTSIHNTTHNSNTQATAKR